MSDPFEPEIGRAENPKPEDVSFDLDWALASVVSVRAAVPPDAFTASILGTERAGHGVIIDEDGLVLTIGYLVTEAETVWLVGQNGVASAAHVVAYDQVTGFGLVQALQPLDLPVIDLGSSHDLEVGDKVIVSGFGGRGASINARVLSKRSFAGSWDYMIDDAIFTAPGHPNWGGAGMFGPDGRLCGIASLAIQQMAAGEPLVDGNMIVPIDLLKPILGDLRTTGKTTAPPRPWLGMFTTEAEGRLIVTGLAEGGPADLAGLEAGDTVSAVGDMPVEELADMYRSIWGLGEAGVEVPLTVFRDGEVVDLLVRSVDRAERLKTPRLH